MSLSRLTDTRSLDFIPSGRRPSAYYWWMTSGSRRTLPWVDAAEARTLSETPLQPSPQRIADCLKITLEQLDEAFLAHRGLPTLMSLRNLRLDNVFQVLDRRPDLGLGEAAHMAGYWRSSVFFNDFTLRVGPPPRSWRRRTRTGASRLS